MKTLIGLVLVVFFCTLSCASPLDSVTKFAQKVWAPFAPLVTSPTKLKLKDGLKKSAVIQMKNSSDVPHHRVPRQISSMLQLPIEHNHRGISHHHPERHSNSATTPLDTLAQFAKRFWTTMVTVARDEVRLKREDENFIVTNVTNSSSEEVESTTKKQVEDLTTTTQSHRPTTKATKFESTAVKNSTVGRRKPTTVKPETSHAMSTISHDAPTSTCNDTIDKEEEMFAITQFPHALTKTPINETKINNVDVSKVDEDKQKEAEVQQSVAEVQQSVANVTSHPILDPTSQAVTSLIHAITSAMVLVSEKLDSRLDSVIVHNDSGTSTQLTSLPLVQQTEIEPVNNVQHVEKPKPNPETGALNVTKQWSFVLKSEKPDDGVLNVEQVTNDEADDDVKKKLSPQTRPPVTNVTDEDGECFFDVSDQNDMCDWNFTSSSSIKWSFGLGETAFMQGGPIRDSNGREFGGYAFIDTSAGFVANAIKIQRAEMQSPKLDKTSPSGRCFTFWYNIGGLSADRLRILLMAEEDYEDYKITNRLSTHSTLWERKDNTNSSWLKGEILYTFSKPHRLIFEGFARSGNDHRRKFQGFIAIDDIAMDENSCKAFCTFEGILCGWENEENTDNFDWELGRGSLSHLTGPVRDHGDGPEGGYMFIDSSYPRRPGDMARLKSPQLQPTEGPVCFKFWTHMYGNGIGTLKVIQKSNSEEKVIWEVTGESGNLWHLAQVTVASTTKYQVIFEGVVGRNFLGNIAIDDISFGQGPCPSSPQTALPSRGDCTFEADECGWINAGSGDQYNWIRVAPNQPILTSHGSNTAYKPLEPLSDHSLGLTSGYMLTLERSSIPPHAGDQAYIVGPVLQGSPEGRCFSFYAYMHERAIDTSGPGIGSIRVYLREGSSSILKPIWRLINYEHPDWFFCQAPIVTTDKFQVVLAGTWGSTRQGTISIDDFTFYDGKCSVVPAEAKVMPGECTFDSNTCEWSSVVDNKELSTWQLSTSNRRPATLNDHTYRGTSGYVFFDIFSQHPHLVRLESPLLASNAGRNSTDDDNDVDPADEMCLTFWFAPFGSSNRNTFLRIIQKNLETEQESIVWEVTSAHLQVFRPDWIYGQVALATNFTHKLTLEGSSNNGGFAVDDILFVPEHCESRPVNSRVENL